MGRSRQASDERERASGWRRAEPLIAGGIVCAITFGVGAFYLAPLLDGRSDGPQSAGPAVAERDDDGEFVDDTSDHAAPPQGLPPLDAAALTGPPPERTGGNVEVLTYGQSEYFAGAEIEYVGAWVDQIEGDPDGGWVLAVLAHIQGTVPEIAVECSGEVNVTGLPLDRSSHQPGNELASDGELVEMHLFVPGRCEPSVIVGGSGVLVEYQPDVDEPEVVSRSVMMLFTDFDLELIEQLRADVESWSSLKGARVGSCLDESGPRLEVVSCDDAHDSIVFSTVPLGKTWPGHHDLRLQTFETCDADWDRAVELVGGEPSNAYDLRPTREQHARGAAHALCIVTP